MGKKGFVLIEILLAVAMFSIIAGVFISLMIDTYRINQRTRDLTQATILAEEGMEAVRSIRDINFAELVITASPARSRCLVIENNRWILVTKKNSRGTAIIDCKEKIGNFERQVYSTNINANSRRITILVTWTSVNGLKKEIRLYSLLTNWR